MQVLDGIQYLRILSYAPELIISTTARLSFSLHEYPFLKHNPMPLVQVLAINTFIGHCLQDDVANFKARNWPSTNRIFLENKYQQKSCYSVGKRPNTNTGKQGPEDFLMTFKCCPPSNAIYPFIKNQTRNFANKHMKSTGEKILNQKLGCHWLI